MATLALRTESLSIYALRENESKDAQTLINQVCQQQGETFNKDPYFISTFDSHVGVKTELVIKSKINSSKDPNFLILCLRDDTETAKGNWEASPMRSSVVLNLGRDEKGALKSYFLSCILLFLYYLPYIFVWGFEGFFKALNECYLHIFNTEIFAEITEHLGVKMSDVYHVEYLATELGQLGKGYGKQLLQVFHETADKERKHVLLYSSSKKNVGFYKRLGYEEYKNYGKDCTFMFRRFQVQKKNN